MSKYIYSLNHSNIIKNFLKDWCNKNHKRMNVSIELSNFTDSFHVSLNQVLCDFWNLSLALFDAATFYQTLVGLPGYIHEFVLERFHGILKLFGLVLSAINKLIDVVSIFLETLIDGCGEFFVDERFNFAQKVSVFSHDSFHNLVDSCIHSQKQ